MMYGVEVYPKKGKPYWESVWRLRREANAIAENLSCDDSVTTVCTYAVEIEPMQSVSGHKYKDGKRVR